MPSVVGDLEMEGVTEKESHKCDVECKEKCGKFDIGKFFDEMLAEFDCKTESELMAKAADAIGKRGVISVMSNKRVRRCVHEYLRETHKFVGINADTGNRLGAVPGNLLWNLGGKDNVLCDIGKVVFDNIVTGKFKRKVETWRSPNGQLETHNLDFETERKRCLEEKTLFEDPEFPAENDWLRPHAIVKDPQFIADGHPHFDAVQAGLGGCWLIAAVSCFSLHEELFYRVVPPEQSFTDNYAGIFHFQFWRYGSWMDVVIDDRLPCVDVDGTPKLRSMHSATSNEFWSALLEKAYAKFYGSYSVLREGWIADALEDLTGGIGAHLVLSNASKETVLACMVKAMEVDTMLGCAAMENGTESRTAEESGTVGYRAYTVTAIQKVLTTGGEVILLRLRNPYGNGFELKGAWSDGSPQWETIDKEDRKRLAVEFDVESEFWLSLEDFMRDYKMLDVCYLGADAMDEVGEMLGVKSVGKGWKSAAICGSWSKDAQTAGGSDREKPEYANNPQYAVSVKMERGSLSVDGKCTVIVALMRKHRNEATDKEAHMRPIAFSGFRCNTPRTHLSGDFFKATTPCCTSSGQFAPFREVVGRFRIPPGDFIIVPSAHDVGEEGEFLLRIFASDHVKVRELKTSSS